MTTIAEEVWLYVKGRPYLQDSLRKGVINYSSLARIIQVESGEKNFEAVKAALIRAAKRLQAGRKSHEREIHAILRKSRLEIKNKIAVVIARERLRIPCIAVVKGPSVQTHIIEEAHSEGMNRKRVTLERNLSLITIISPEAIERTPGVTAHILSSLAAENINVVELFSCYTDTLLVFRDSDMIPAFQILSRAMGSDGQ